MRVIGLESVLLRRDRVENKRALAGKRRKGEPMQVRFARHTGRLAELVRFYRDGLGLPEIGRFQDHDGYDGVFLDLPGSNGHLEFTSGGNHEPPVPHAETATSAQSLRPASGRPRSRWSRLTRTGAATASHCSIPTVSRSCSSPTPGPKKSDRARTAAGSPVAIVLVGRAHADPSMTRVSTSTSSGSNRKARPGLEHPALRRRQARLAKRAAACGRCW